MSKPQARHVGGNDHVYCFVPSEDIDIVVLAAYLQAFIDATATIKPSRHPRDKDKLGYTIGARQSLGREQLEDLISDTHCWLKEQKSSEFLASHSDYHDSDTWQSRKKKGLTASASIKRPPVRLERHSASLISDAQEEHGFRGRSMSYGQNCTVQWKPHFRTSGCRCGTCDDCSAKEACNVGLPSDTGFAQPTANTTVEHDIPLLETSDSIGPGSTGEVFQVIVHRIPGCSYGGFDPSGPGAILESLKRQHESAQEEMPCIALLDERSSEHGKARSRKFKGPLTAYYLYQALKEERFQAARSNRSTRTSLPPRSIASAMSLKTSLAGLYNGTSEEGWASFALKSFKSSDSLDLRQEQDLLTRLSMMTSDDMLLPCVTATENHLSSRTKADNMMQKQRPLLRFNLQRPAIFAGAMTLNAVTVACSSEAMTEGSSGNLAMLHAIGGLSSNHSQGLHRQQSVLHDYTLPPEVYLAAYAAFGALLVYMAKQTPDHIYEDSVFFGSVVFGVMAVIADAYLGTPLQSSICRVMPIALLCGQLISLVIGKLAGKLTMVKDQSDEKVSDEKN